MILARNLSEIENKNLVKNFSLRELKNRKSVRKVTLFLLLQRLNGKGETLKTRDPRTLKFRYASTR